MELPDFVWSAAEVIGSSTDFTDKMTKYLRLIAGECSADNGIVWVPADDGSLRAVGTEISDPMPFEPSAVNSIRKNIASVAEVGGMYVMSLPVSEKHTTYRACVQLLRGKPFDSDDLGFFIEAGELFTRIVTEFRPKNPVNPDNEEPFIRIRGLRKSFVSGGGKTEVFRGLDLDIYENELVVVLGASGTGKTTLLNILGGLDRADEGSIVVGKQDVSGMDDEALRKYRRNNVGFVFQFYNLLPNLTALENIRYVAELSQKHGSPAKMLEMVGMSPCADKYPSQMSSGQQQRISIARALVKKPKVILADEPTGALDLSSGKEVLGIFESITSEKRGPVVLITHNTELARFADRVIRLEQGRISTITRNEYKVRASELIW